MALSKPRPSATSPPEQEQEDTEAPADEMPPAKSPSVPYVVGQSSSTVAAPATTRDERTSQAIPVHINKSPVPKPPGPGPRVQAIATPSRPGQGQPTVRSQSHAARFSTYPGRSQQLRHHRPNPVPRIPIYLPSVVTRYPPPAQPWMQPRPSYGGYQHGPAPGAAPNAGQSGAPSFQPPLPYTPHPPRPPHPVHTPPRAGWSYGTPIPGQVRSNTGQPHQGYYGRPQSHAPLRPGPHGYGAQRPSSAIETPTKTGTTSSVANRGGTRPLVVDGTGPFKKPLVVATSSTSPVTPGPSQPSWYPPTRAAESRRAAPQGGSFVKSSPIPPTTPTFAFQRRGLPEWPSPEKQPHAAVVQDGYRAPENTPISRVPRVSTAVNVRRVAQALISGLLAISIENRRTAEETRARKEAEAAEALLALARATQAVTAEVHEAFAEADVLFDELNRVHLTQPKTSKDGLSDDEAGTDSQGTEENPIDEQQPEPVWPPEWSLVVPMGGFEASSNTGEQLYDDDKLAPAFRAAVEMVEDLLGHDKASTQDTTAESKSPMQSLPQTTSTVTSEQGNQTTASPFPTFEYDALTDVVHLSENPLHTSTGTAEAAGTEEKAPVSRRATDVRVALPEFSLLGLRTRSSSAVKEPTRQEEAKREPPSKTPVPAQRDEEKPVETLNLNYTVSSLRNLTHSCAQFVRQTLDNRPTNHTARRTATRIVNPPPGFAHFEPVRIYCTPPPSPVTVPSTPATRPNLLHHPDFARRVLQHFSTSERVARFQQGIRIYQQNSPTRQPESLTHTLRSSAYNMDPSQSSGSSYLSQQDLDADWPDFRNKAARYPPKTRQPSRAGQNTIEQPAAAGAPPHSRLPNVPHTDEEIAARLARTKADWARCVGKSDDVAVERLTWEQMRRYYPGGPPRHLGRYVPIPDAWQASNPLRLAAAEEKLARRNAGLDRIFYSGSRFWTMSMAEMVEDVRLRHLFAAYLDRLGLSRAEFDREYGAFVDVFANADDASVPARSFLGPMTAVELLLPGAAAAPPREVTAPMVNMAFRNLLLLRAEAALPEGHETIRSFAARRGEWSAPGVAAAAQRRKPHPFGAIGDEWKRWKREQERKEGEAEADAGHAC